MDLIKELEKQIELLNQINDNLKESDPREVRSNVDTINNLVRTIHFIENN